ncbi:hypothetical protein ACSNOK_21190 [Streptomyces sp. URMC 126]|uniref:hypothetical protein n=1 Tax=Streptomyces sp. URMC 126 TaxID=3423401 RepID=UPI003F1AC926
MTQESGTALAHAASTPVAPYTHIQRFDHTGSVQEFTVPPGVTTIDARCWGGGGRKEGDVGGGSEFATGGGGGFAAGTVAVQSGETLAVVVDQGGGERYGGGMSGLFSRRLGQTLLIAGGGGAGWVEDGVTLRGGPGGGAGGSDGQGLARGSWTGTPARGASGSTGGAGATTVGGFGGRGGDTGQDGGSGKGAITPGRMPIPGMGGGGGAGYGSRSGGGGGYAGGGGGVSVGTAADAYHSSAGGGSGFVGGPGVTGGRTVAGSGGEAGGKDDPLYQSPTGDAGRRGQVVLQWTEFTVSPGGPPDVTLKRGGAVGYPGVRVDGDVAFAPVPVTVALPPGGGLLFGTSALPDHQLTVMDATGHTRQYPGTPSPDGTSLTFSGVDLGLPGTTVMWVGVSATHDAPLGTTNLTFAVGGQAAASTPVVVGPAFTVSPGGGPVTAHRGGSPVYPGVEVRNDHSASIPPQDVTATLPAGHDLRFGVPGNPDHQLTVMRADGHTTAHMGSVSDDGQALTFTGIDLEIPGDGSRSALWVCVSAAADTPPGPTSVRFTVGDVDAPSTTIEVL